MVEKSYDKSVKILKALADPMRLSIAQHLASSAELVSSQEIVQSCARRLELSQPAMSHHFKKLTESGVVLIEKRGTENFYKLNQELCEMHGIDIRKL